MKGSATAHRLDLGAVIDGLPAMVAYVDREHRYRYVNHAYEQRHGRTGGQDHQDDRRVEIHGLAVEVLDDLENLGAVPGRYVQFHQHHFLDDRILVRVLEAMDHVDELVALHDDLVQSLGMAADAHGHARVARVAALGDDERVNIEPAPAEHGADAAQDAGLVGDGHAEGVDVHDVGQRSGLVVGGWNLAFGHSGEGDKGKGLRDKI